MGENILKVKPYKAHRKLNEDTARVIVINRVAIKELLTETIIENMSKLFNLDGNPDNYCEMYWDEQKDELTCMVTSFKCGKNHEIDLKEISERIGITSNSLFKKCSYRTITFGEEKRQTKKTGDGSLS